MGLSVEDVIDERVSHERVWPCHFKIARLVLYIDNRFPVTAFKILLAKNKNSPSVWKVKQPCILEYYQNASILKRVTYH